MYRDQRVSQREAIRTIHSRKYNEIDNGRFNCPPIETQPALVTSGSRVGKGHWRRGSTEDWVKAIGDEGRREVVLGQVCLRWSGSP